MISVVDCTKGKPGISTVVVDCLDEQLCLGQKQGNKPYKVDKLAPITIVNVASYWVGFHIQLALPPSSTHHQPQVGSVVRWSRHQQLW